LNLENFAQGKLFVVNGNIPRLFNGIAPKTSTEDLRFAHRQFIKAVRDNPALCGL